MGSFVIFLLVLAIVVAILAYYFPKVRAWIMAIGAAVLAGAAAFWHSIQGWLS